MGDTLRAEASDIAVRSWIDRLAPETARPYLRLARIDRPIGTWLLLFPCWWGLALASGGWPDPRLAALFAVGALIMRGAGCTFNDLVDRDFDRRVARTALRPIASGAISVRRAILFLLAQLALALIVLWQFNAFTVALAAASLALVFAYPLMKRITYWPQAVLGLTFNWGALVGWSAVEATLGAPALALYAGGFFWTLGYDTIYAHQDKEDDRRIGIKSSALRLGAATRPWLFVFYGAAVLSFAAAGLLADLAWPFYLGAAAVAAQLAWQAGTVAIDDAKDCLATFRSNRWVGWLLLGGIVAGRLAA